MGRQGHGLFGRDASTRGCWRRGDAGQRARRIQRQIARREQQIADARRKMATSWFNVAIAYYNLARNADARQFAERVADDEQFGERARELLSRLR